MGTRRDNLVRHAIIGAGAILGFGATAAMILTLGDGKTIHALAAMAIAGITATGVIHWTSAQDQEKVVGTRVTISLLGGFGLVIGAFMAGGVIAIAKM